MLQRALLGGNSNAQGDQAPLRSECPRATGTSWGKAALICSASCAAAAQPDREAILWLRAAIRWPELDRSTPTGQGLAPAQPRSAPAGQQLRSREGPTR